jgi:hypothetical protein
MTVECSVRVALGRRVWEGQEATTYVGHTLVFFARFDMSCYLQEIWTQPAPTVVLESMLPQLMLILCLQSTNQIRFHRSRLRDNHSLKLHKCMP